MKRKEDHLPHLHEDMFQPLIFRWVNFLTLTLRSANHKGKITFESSTSTAIGYQSNSPGKLKPQNDGFFSMGFPKISFKKREWDPFFSGWWLNQPIWKIWSSNWKSSPNRAENSKYLSCHHPVFFGKRTSFGYNLGGPSKSEGQSFQQMTWIHRSHPGKVKPR